MVKIVPAILAKNLSEFTAKVHLFEKYFKLAQIDAMDGCFVKNKTFFDFKKISKIKAQLDYEVHLMVKEPLKVVQEILKFSKIKKIIFHVEAVNNKQCLDLIQLIKKNKKQVGLAINPATDLRKIKPYFNKIDYLLIMGVDPGWSAQELNSKVYARIKKAKKLKPKLEIGVDGGVNDQNARYLIKAGADVLNSASYLLESSDIKQAIVKLKKYGSKAKNKRNS